MEFKSIKLFNDLKVIVNDESFKLPFGLVAVQTSKVLQIIDCIYSTLVEDVSTAKNSGMKSLQVTQDLDIYASLESLVNVLYTNQFWCYSIAIRQRLNNSIDEIEVLYKILIGK